MSADGFSPETFIAGSTWTTAKSSPHEYVVVGRGAESREGFYAFVAFVREHGYEARWDGQPYVDYEPGDGFRYWSMAAPINETVLVNRAPVPKPSAQLSLEVQA
jgi:hypothetical protein